MRSIGALDDVILAMRWSSEPRSECEVVPMRCVHAGPLASCARCARRSAYGCVLWTWTWTCVCVHFAPQAGLLQLSFADA